MTAIEKHDKAMEAFNNHDAEKVVEFYSPDAILTDPSYNEPQIGRDAIRKDYEKLFRSFPDISVSRHGVFGQWFIRCLGNKTDRHEYGPHRNTGWCNSSN